MAEMYPSFGALGMAEPVKVGEQCLSDTSLSTADLTPVGSFGSGSSLGCFDPAMYEYHEGQVAVVPRGFEDRSDMPTLAPPPGLEQQAPKVEAGLLDAGELASAYDEPLLRQTSEDSVSWLRQMQLHQMQMHMEAAAAAQAAVYLQAQAQMRAAGMPYWPHQAAMASHWHQVPEPAQKRKGSPKQAAAEQMAHETQAKLEPKVPLPPPPPLDSSAILRPPPETAPAGEGLSPGLHCDTLDSGAFRVRWAVESRKFKSNDKSIVSAPFEVPALAPATFKLVVAAKQVSESRRGNSFRKAKGGACVQLKCQTEPEGSQADMTFRIDVSGQGIKEALDCRHDFRLSPLCTCLESFNFSPLVATETPCMLVISLEFLPGSK